MSTTFNAAFDRSTELLFEMLTSEQIEKITRFRADEALRDRIDELAGKCTEHELTDEERAEYDGYVRANSFIATLQMQARKLLSPREVA
jgi:hypothetical protein